MDHSILEPALAMVVLTFVVWVVMYVLRLGYISTKKLDVQLLSSPEKMSAALPERVNNAANNLKNLFEVPVLFYVLCFYIAVAGISSEILVTLAWTYVSLRALHSLVHCSVNIVKLRFTFYFVSCVVLISMLFLIYNGAQVG
ncbi:MAG: hypothetical protein EVA59_01760 [Limnobacter sp.]|uniref:MAPEG family protein n=1 Tax=Limnobacter TaxID=131079 RepID=UPI00120BF8E5|nr:MULTISPECIES: MAPEG family protein [unclassified Limnobacter]RZO94495.1 MAG: hypothetical protein EVA59_01760 [Limnobacter sp.]